MELSPSMKVLTEEKLHKLLSKLERIRDAEKSFRVVLNTAPKETFEVKIEADIRGKVFFAQGTNLAFETALILTVEELERQIIKWIKELGHEKNWEKVREQKHYTGA